MNEVLTDVTKEAVKPVISELIRNCVSQLNKQYNKYLIPLREHFELYLKNAYASNSRIRTLVFDKQEMDLMSIYVPLTVCQEGLVEERREYKITKMPKSWIGKKILITDAAGMGKSTISKRLFLDIYENGWGVPMLIELRRLSADVTLLDDVLKQVGGLTKPFDKSLLLELFSLGGFVFILDGYDEISQDNIGAVTKQLVDFIGKASNNTFILTSRPGEVKSAFHGFEYYRVNPLTRKEAYQLIRNYDKTGKTARLLIEELEKPQFKNIRSFLVNPLMVTLLFLAFDFKKNIPPRKHLFYRQVFDALYERHDVSKDGYFHRQTKTNLPQDDFEKVFRFMGFACIRKQQFEFDRERIGRLIDKSKEEYSGLVFNTSDFLFDILNNIPLFCRDGDNSYRWSHKSIAEYFAVCYLTRDAKENQKKLVDDFISSDNPKQYYNVFDLYYDIDKNAFDEYVLLPALKQLPQNVSHENEDMENVKYFLTNNTYVIYNANDSLSMRDLRSFSPTFRGKKPSEVIIFPNNYQLFKYPNSNNDFFSLLVQLLFEKKSRLVRDGDYKPLTEDLRKFIEGRLGKDKDELILNADKANSITKEEVADYLSFLTFFSQYSIIFNFSLIGDEIKRITKDINNKTKTERWDF